MLLAACLLGSVILPNSYEWAMRNFRRDRFSIFKAVGVGAVLAVSICFLDRISEFLYFQF